MPQSTDNNIAHISDRGDAVQKTANLTYHKPIERNGFIYSIDMVRLKFKMKTPRDVEKIMNTIRDRHLYTYETPYDYDYIERKAYFMYRHNFNIHMKNGQGFYLAFSFNDNSKEKICEGVMEFNPNKCFGQEVSFMNMEVDEQTGEESHIYVYNGDLLNYFLINLISLNAKYVKLVRFDLAIDIPYPKKQVRLIKDNRTYKVHCPSQDSNTYTEYLGKHNNSGFIKVYNKTIESNLDHDVTRLEITSEYGKDYKKFMSQFPQVFVKGNGSLFPYMELKNTDLVLYELLMDSSNMEQYFKRLGRDKQKKLKPYLYQDTNDILVTVTEDVYHELMEYIRDMAGLKELLIKA